MLGVVIILVVGVFFFFVIEIVEEYGISLIGFIKVDCCNIYCGEGRVLVEVRLLVKNIF